MVNSVTISYEDLTDQIRKAWADVLGSDPADGIPLDMNFLEAGGNSLLLVMLWELLQPLAARRLKLAELFQHGTVKAQADLLHQPPGS